MTSPARIAVLGAGLMGHGIAQVFAGSGMNVAVYDPAPQSLATLRDRIAANLTQLGAPLGPELLVTGTPSLEHAVAGAEFVFEAALEDLRVKQELFAQAAMFARPDAILASNTSVIPISEIMSGLKNPERGIGTHWWNPPFLIPLVEVVGTAHTSEQVVAKMMSLLHEAGKTPVRVRMDVPGFIGNRLQHALWREAISLVERGICSAEDVDTVVKASFGRRLGVLGPLENADLVGTDLTLAIHRTILPAIESRAAASPYLENLVGTGRLGMKSGEGFRRWTGEQIAALRRDLFNSLRGAQNPVKAKTS